MRYVICRTRRPDVIGGFDVQNLRGRTGQSDDAIAGRHGERAEKSMHDRRRIPPWVDGDESDLDRLRAKTLQAGETRKLSERRWTGIAAVREAEGQEHGRSTLLLELPRLAAIVEQTNVRRLPRAIAHRTGRESGADREKGRDREHAGHTNIVRRRNRPVKPAVLAVRVLLGGLLLAAGALKAGHPSALAASIAAFRLLPAGIVGPLAYALPYLEIVLGFYLVVGLFTRIAAVISAAQFVLYAGAIASAVVRRLPVSCGCFGPQDSGTADWPHVGFDLLLAIASAFVVYGAPGAFALDRRLKSA